MIKNKGFKTTLPYWDLPKESFLDIGFHDSEYANIHCIKIICHSFFSIKLNSKAMEEIKKKVYNIQILGVEKFDKSKYSTEFRFDFYYPDLVRILEIIEEESKSKSL